MVLGYAPETYASCAWLIDGGEISAPHKKTRVADLLVKKLGKRGRLRTRTAPSHRASVSPAHSGSTSLYRSHFHLASGSRSHSRSRLQSASGSEDSSDAQSDMGNELQDNEEEGSEGNSSENKGLEKGSQEGSDEGFEEGSGDGSDLDSGDGKAKESDQEPTAQSDRETVEVESDGEANTSQGVPSLPEINAKDMEEQWKANHHNFACSKDVEFSMWHYKQIAKGNEK